MRTIKEMLEMSGRVAVVTGGAGHLGRVTAETLAELGTNLVLIDINSKQLEITKEELQSKFSVDVLSMMVDMESQEEMHCIRETIERHYGRLDVIVNNAAFVGTSGLGGWVTEFETQKIDTWRRALEVNLTAPFSLVQSCAALLRKSDSASVINISSIYGLLGPDLSLYEGTSMGNPAAYAASKGGLIQLTRWLSTVLGTDARVNSITPGGIARNQPESFVQKYSERTPLKRLAIEEDFKGAIAYLASDLSSYMTGQNLVVDGGWSVW